jgi:acyl-CoA thioesterase YciA
MELLNTHPIKKSDLGFHGNLFGGKLLAWIDAAAAGFSMQLCDTPRMVTVSIDQCNFERPAKESQLLKIYGHPKRVGNSSITLYMEARAHNVYTGKQDLVLKTNTTFVQIDEGGNAIPLGEKAKNRINLFLSKSLESEK